MKRVTFVVSERVPVGLHANPAPAKLPRAARAGEFCRAQDRRPCVNKEKDDGTCKAERGCTEPRADDCVQSARRPANSSGAAAAKAAARRME